MADDYRTSRVLAIEGVRLAAVDAGIDRRARDDLALIEICAGGAVAGVFTRNRFTAAPVVISERNLRTAAARYLLVNSGCANAGLGDAGIAAAMRCCDELAGLTGVPANEVLPFSTGVIGAPLPVDKIVAQLPRLQRGLAGDGWSAAAAAIMTTDTVAKCDSRRVPTAAGDVLMTGIAKGSGMIHPDMATMLAFIATDLSAGKEALMRLLGDGCDDSFNAITVDGDTSSNDACVLMASGKSGVAWGGLADDERGKIRDALHALMQSLAKAIARDGEGATRLIEVRVTQAASKEEARSVARTIALSPLVKTACYAGDPNWGRIIAALGRSPVERLDLARVRCEIGGHCVFENGAVSPGYDEQLAQQAMAGGEIVIHVALACGGHGAVVWTSDLTEEYVRINVDYRS